jgi:hypothetical protein
MLPAALIIAWGCRNTWEIRHGTGWVRMALLIMLWLVSVCVLSVNSASPFLYFQF